MNTIERIVPEQVAANDLTGQPSLALHIQRYEFAAEHLKPGRLLDIACGAGYGTHLMASRNLQVTEALGVDISSEAIQYANQNYALANVHFHQENAMLFDDKEGFDSIVSIETLEHVPDPIGLFDHLMELLHPGGVIIGSVPTTLSTDVNPYHLNDFSEKSFRQIANRFKLDEIKSLQQIQPYLFWKTWKREEARMKDMRPNLISYYFNNPVKFIQRLWSTLRFGFTNRYLTVVWKKGI